MTFTTRTVEVCELHKDHEWAIFTIAQEPQRSRYTLTVESSYGFWGYTWSDLGTDFYTFLAGLDSYYVGKKMVDSDMEFDGDASRAAIRKEILQRRRTREFTAQQARDEWGLEALQNEFASPLDFHLWTQETKEFNYDDFGEFYQTCPGRQARDFRRMYDLFWAEFWAEFATLKGTK